MRPVRPRTDEAAMSTLPRTEPPPAAGAAAHEGPPRAVAPHAPRTGWRGAARALLSGRGTRVALAFLGAMVLLALAAPLLAAWTGHGPDELFQREMTDDFGLPRGPNGDFLLGADTAGRDLLVRIAYGARVSLAVGLGATAVAVLVGLVLGLLAGYRGGFLDTVVSRSGEVVLALPVLVFAIGIVSACGSTREGCMAGTVRPGVPLVIVVISLFTWPYVARLVRTSTVSLRERGFVEASRAAGAGDVRIMARQILPNLLPPVIVYAAVLVPQNILFEASLSFLGLGVPDAVPSWGRMLADASDVIDVAWWLTLFPGLALVATVLALTVVGDGLRDALDPRSDGR